MCNPDFPMAVGVIYREEKASFIEDSRQALSTARLKKASLQGLLQSGHTWEVSAK